MTVKSARIERNNEERLLDVILRDAVVEEMLGMVFLVCFVPDEER